MKFLRSWILDKYGVITAFQFYWELLLTLESMPHAGICGQYNRQIKGLGILSTKVIVKKIYITL